MARATKNSNKENASARKNAKATGGSAKKVKVSKY